MNYRVTLPILSLLMAACAAPTARSPVSAQASTPPRTPLAGHWLAKREQGPSLRLEVDPLPDGSWHARYSRAGSIYRESRIVLSGQRIVIEELSGASRCALELQMQDTHLLAGTREPCRVADGVGIGIEWQVGAGQWRVTETVIRAGTHTPSQILYRRLSQFQAQVALRPEGDEKWQRLAPLSLHDDAELVPIGDERHALRLSTTELSPGLSLLQLSLITLADGQEIAYVLADPESRTLGMQLGWFQVLLVGD